MTNKGQDTALWDRLGNAYEESRRALMAKAARGLEFDKIKDSLSGATLTSQGAQLARALFPLSSLELIEEAQQETAEAVHYLEQQGSVPFSAFQDSAESLTLARKGAVLSPRMLLDIVGSLRAAAQARAQLASRQEQYPLLADMAALLTPTKALQNEIERVILSEDEISDNASPELYQIRRQLRILSERVRDKLQSLAHSASFSKYLQDNLVTQRNGRYVLPVRQEYRQQVPGLIHDQSSSGATLFIEPMAIVDMGNDIKQWQAKEEAEISRLLAELSHLIGEQANGLSANMQLLFRLDLIFAKGSLALAQRAIRPVMNDKGQIRLINARHPLIDQASVVPISLTLGESFSTLLITGPNTGGKTVTLKTVGLLSLMAMSGLHVPADPETRLALFDGVFADIGDEQSIEQSLSTFSAHMTNIVQMLELAEDNDLLLFDELGAGTDPTEGAALAQTILDHLLKRRIRSMATTHYSELKAYALATPGAENASVEFDVSTLRPTFRLFIGIPGKSNAFEIARRLGLSDTLIQGARHLLSQDDKRFEEVIAQAETQRQKAEQDRQRAQEDRYEANRLRAEAKAARDEAEQKREAAVGKAKREAKKILERVKAETSQMMATLTLMQKQGASRADVQALSQQMRALEDSLADRWEPETDDAAVQPLKEIKVGDNVMIRHLGAEATVLSLPDNKGDVQLQAGAVKMMLPLNALTKVEAPKNKKKSQVKTNVSMASRAVATECDLRGMDLLEAIARADQFMQDAVMSGLHEVFLVHGKGTGVLRSGLQAHLRHHMLVSGFRKGKYGEGEDGVTVVSLK